VSELRIERIDGVDCQAVVVCRIKDDSMSNKVDAALDILDLFPRNSSYSEHSERGGSYKVANVLVPESTEGWEMV
jgi:hypothetical protein